jgi:hypothetical protein
MRALRTEEWFMVGVVGLGTYAAYRLLTAPSDQTPAGAAPRPLPPRPGILQAPVGDASVLRDPATLSLVRGRYYRGRIETVGADGRALAPPFAPTSTAREIRQGLISMGFSSRIDGAAVFMSPTEQANSDRATPPWALAGAGAGTRFFYAEWAGSTGTIARPPGFVAVWADLAPGQAPR